MGLNFNPPLAYYSHTFMLNGHCSLFLIYCTSQLTGLGYTGGSPSRKFDSNLHESTMQALKCSKGLWLLKNKKTRKDKQTERIWASREKNKRLLLVNGGYTGLQWVTSGYTRLHVDTQGYMWIHRVTIGYMQIHRVTVGYMWIHRVTVGYMWIHRVTISYTGLQWVTCGYTGLHVDTPGYNKLHRVTVGYMEAQTSMISTIHIPIGSYEYLKLQKGLSATNKCYIYLKHNVKYQG